MKTYQVELPDEFAEIVDQMIADGNWDSVDGIFMDGLLRAQDDLTAEAQDSDELRWEIPMGISHADRGELVDGPAMIDDFRKMLFASRLI
jgi:Arc/MetJ-type ribon-helix-helix transcriptional regulator